MAQKILLLILITLIASTPLLIQTCHAQPTAIEDKATSFLSDVIQLDLSKYKLTLNPQYTETDQGHLFYDLNAADDILSLSQGDVTFSFTNGTLGTCSLNPSLAGMKYTNPYSGRFNTTLGILERYHAWTNDSQVQKMVDLLQKVGSEKAGLQVDGNLSVRISIYQSGLGTYQFSNYFNGVEYTSIQISMGNQTAGDVFFTDTRVFEKTGNTTLGISRDQAIAIATEAVKHYSYNATFENGTSAIVKDFNVTGVYAVGLSSELKENMTLYPLYDVQLNVTGLPSRTTGLGVKIWANDGAVQAVYLYVYPGDGTFTDLWNAISVFPMILSTVASLAFVIVVLVLVVTVLVIVLRKNKTRSG